MAKLGDLYFDVLLRDMTDDQIKNIADKLKRGSVKLNFDREYFVANIREALKNQTFGIKVVVNKAEAADAVRAALQKAALSKLTYTPQDARRDKVTAYNAVQEQKKATETARTAAAEAKAALAAERLAKARNTETGATNNATTANKKLAMSHTQVATESKKSSGFMTSLMNMARNYTGAFGLVSFLRQLVQIRGEFERQQVALESIMQSAAQSRTLFSDFQSMAVKSPYQFSEILQYAKQLAAFQIPNRELYDTTKKLADLSSGLGVDMSRVILAYGQVRSAAYLRGQELRQFTEAGIPMVQKLADKFTQLEGRVVGAGEVIDRISQRGVSFDMVKSVIDDMTNEGGKFYDMQEKQAQTLYGKVSNLGDAWQIMLNHLGESTDTLLKAPIEAVTAAMNHWEATIRTIVGLLAANSMRKWFVDGNARIMSNGADEFFANARSSRQQALMSYYFGGGAKVPNMKQYTYQLATTAAKEGQLTQAMANRLYVTGKLEKEQLIALSTANNWDAAVTKHVTGMNRWTILLNRAKLSFRGLGASMVSAFTGVLPALAIGLVADFLIKIVQAHQEISKFNDEVHDAAKNANDDLKTFFKQNDEALDFVVNAKVDVNEGDVRSAWDKIKEQLENLSNGDSIVAKLTTEEDMQKRVQDGYNYLKMVQNVRENIANLQTTLKYTQVLAYGVFGEGAQTDLADYEDYLKKVRDAAKELHMTKNQFVDTYHDYKNSNLDNFSDYNNDISWMLASREEAIKEIEKSLKSSLIPALDEIREKGIKTPEAMLAAYQQLMPQIFDGVQATSVDAKELIEAEAADMMKQFGASWEDIVYSSAATTSDFITRMKNEARRENVDLNQLILNNDTQRLQEIASRTLNNANDVTRKTYEMFKTMVGNISRLKATIQVNLDVNGDKGILQSWVSDQYKRNNKSDGKGPLLNMQQRYGKYADTGTRSYAEQQQYLQQQYKAYKESLANVNKMLKTVKKTDTSYGGLQKQRRALENSIQNAKNFAADTGFSLISDADKKKANASGNKSTNKNRTGDKTDNIANNLKQQYTEYKNAIQQVQDMNAKFGRTRTKQIIKDLDLFSNLNRQLIETYVRKGPAALAEHFIKKLGGRNTKEANQLRQTLRKDRESSFLKDLTSWMESQLASLKSLIKVTDETWKTYDSLLSQTGDENFSSLFSFGKMPQLFTSARQERINIFDTTMSELGVRGSYGSMSKLTAKETESRYGKAVAEIFKSLKESISKESEDLVNTMAKAINDGMSISDKIHLKQSEMAAFRKKWFEQYGKGVFGSPEVKDVLLNGSLSDIGNTTGKMLLDGSQKNALQGLMAVIAQFIKEIDELNDSLLDTSDTWKKLFEDFSSKGYRELVQQRDNVRDAMNSHTLGQDGKYHSNNKGLPTLSAGEYTKLTKQYNSIEKEVGDQNPFERLKKGGKGAVDALRAITQAASDAGSAFSAMASAMGDDATADTVGFVNDLANGLTDVAAGFAEMSSGNPMGVFTAAKGLFSSITAFFNFHDKKMERIIKNSQRRTKVLENTYSQVTKAIERSLGGAYSLANGTGKVYEQQLDNLKNQLKELETQRQAEDDKKNTDQDKLIDYDKQIADLNDQIKHFAEDTLKELMDVDLKSWADQISEALTNAFVDGEDAARTFNDTVASIIKSLTSKMISLYVIQPLFEKVKDYLFGTNGAFSTDKKLTEDEIPGLIQALMTVKDGINSAEELYKVIEAAAEQAGIDLKGSSSSNLGKGIQSITENTADLLASYLNAIRADVSMIRQLQQGMNGASALLQSQLQQLTSIAQNTLRNAEAADEIVSFLNAITYAGTKGRTLRV